jgi:hypothetical protein
MCILAMCILAMCILAMCILVMCILVMCQVKDFLTSDECERLIKTFIMAEQKPSALFPEQEHLRTSTSVIPADDEVEWLRTRISKLAHVSTDQLEPTKLTRYEKGQFFRRHTDTVHATEKLKWLKRVISDKETRKELEAPTEACWWPDRFCTVFICNS